MSREYERIIDWFLTMLGDEKVRQLVLEWLGAAHDQAATTSCVCTYCTAAHRVLHLFKDMKRNELLDGSPWIRVAAMSQIVSFLDTLPETPQTQEAAAACAAEFARIIQDNSLPKPEPTLRPGIIQMLMGSPQSLVEIMTLLLGSGVDKDDPCMTTIKSLSAAAGEETSDDSGDTTEETAGSDAGDHDHGDDTMNDKKPTPDDKSLLNNPIPDGLVGYSFTKEGVHVTPPSGVTYTAAIEALTKQATEEERIVTVSERINAFVLEGVIAFQNVLAEKYGWVDRVPTPGFFGPTPPQTIEIPTGVGKSTQGIWGRVVIPGIDGFLSTGYEMKESRFYFVIRGEVKRKHMAEVKALIAATEKKCKEASIYKGQALELTLPLPDHDNFSPDNAPNFMDLSSIDEEGLIFSDEVQRSITTNLFVPVTHTTLCRELGINLKRGALLAGEPGTGKTYAASVLAKLCVQHGWTYIYVKHTADVAKMYRLAAEYSPAVLFVEDIDIVASGEKRTQEMNDILLALDGVDTKGAEVFVVFTTNQDPKKLNSAFARARRLDFIIEVKAPDTSAVKKLIRLYSRGRLAQDVTLDKVAEMLAGQIPATIETVCSAALLSAAGRMATNATVADIAAINDGDLEDAAFTQLEQLRLTTELEPIKEAESAEEKAAVFLGGHIERGLEKMSTTIAETLESLADRAPAIEAQKGTNGHTAKPGTHHEPAPEA